MISQKMFWLREGRLPKLTNFELFLFNIFIEHLTVYTIMIVHEIFYKRDIYTLRKL